MELLQLVHPGPGPAVGLQLLFGELKSDHLWAKIDGGSDDLEEVSFLRLHESSLEIRWSPALPPGGTLRLRLGPHPLPALGEHYWIVEPTDPHGVAPPDPKADSPFDKPGGPTIRPLADRARSSQLRHRRRRDFVESLSGTRRREHRFFLLLDERTNTALIRDFSGLTDPRQIVRRIASVGSTTLYLKDRLFQRLGRIPFATAPTDAEVQSFSDVFLDSIEDAFGTGATALAQFETAFERFASGQLISPPQTAPQPDDANFFMFAEFALLVLRRGEAITRGERWLDLLPVMVRTQEAYRLAYRPRWRKYTHYSAYYRCCSRSSQQWEAIFRELRETYRPLDREELDARATANLQAAIDDKPQQNPCLPERCLPDPHA